jgi:hypothetical protein
MDTQTPIEPFEPLRSTTELAERLQVSVQLIVTFFMVGRMSEGTYQLPIVV